MTAQTKKQSHFRSPKQTCRDKPPRRQLKFSILPFSNVLRKYFFPSYWFFIKLISKLYYQLKIQNHFQVWSRFMIPFLTTWRNEACWSWIFYLKLLSNSRNWILLFLFTQYFLFTSPQKTNLHRYYLTWTANKEFFHFEYSYSSINADPLFILASLKCHFRSSRSEFSTVLQITSWFHQVQTYIKHNQKAIGSDHDALDTAERVRKMWKVQDSNFEV